MKKISLTIDQLKNLLNQQKERTIASIWISIYSAQAQNSPVLKENVEASGKASRYPEDIIILERYL